VDKNYFVGGRKATVEELEEVTAIELRKEDAAAAGKWKSTGLEKYGGKTEAEQFKAFEAAGWTFARRSEPGGTSAEHPHLAAAERMARVFRCRSGRILLGTDRLTVRLEASLNEAACLEFFAAEELEIVRTLTFASNLYEVRTRPGNDPLDVSVRLHDRKSVVYAEPQFIEHIGGRQRPTDSGYAHQWHLRNTGQSGGTVGVDIAAEDAWKITRGAKVRLAVVDNGFDLGHSDLSDAIASPSSCGYFDDAGTFVQGVSGHRFDPHGTYCAGIALARANEHNGCGVAFEAEFIAVSCLPDQTGKQATLARAIAYAADPKKEVAGANSADGADVICCSLGPGKETPEWQMCSVLKDAIDFAVNSGRGGKGTPVFWAVTNGPWEIRFDKVCSYPHVIAVGSSTHDDDHGDCGRGPELDFLAPGVDVVTTRAGGTMGLESGTSLAAPVAAGIAALVLAVNSALRWDEVRQIMRDTCKKVGNVTYDTRGHHPRYGFGRVNAAEAVRSAERSGGGNRAPRGDGS
jgi:thermitase